MAHRAEVKGILPTEYDEANKRVASEMLQGGEPLPKIEKGSRLSETIVRQLTHSLGMTIL